MAFHSLKNNLDRREQGTNVGLAYGSSSLLEWSRAKRSVEPRLRASAGEARSWRKRQRRRSVSRPAELTRSGSLRGSEQRQSDRARPVDCAGTPCILAPRPARSAGGRPARRTGRRVVGGAHAQVIMVSPSLSSCPAAVRGWPAPFRVRRPAPVRLWFPRSSSFAAVLSPAFRNSVGEWRRLRTNKSHYAYHTNVWAYWKTLFFLWNAR